MHPTPRQTSRPTMRPIEGVPRGRVSLHRPDDDGRSVSPTSRCLCRSRVQPHQMLRKFLICSYRGIAAESSSFVPPFRQERPERAGRRVAADLRGLTPGSFALEAPSCSDIRHLCVLAAESLDGCRLAAKTAKTTSLDRWNEAPRAPRPPRREAGAGATSIFPTPICRRFRRSTPRCRRPGARAIWGGCGR
jgi:hypothetical protein